MNIHTIIDMPLFAKKTTKRESETGKPLGVGFFERVFCYVRERWGKYQLMKDIRISEREIAEGKERPLRSFADLDAELGR